MKRTRNIYGIEEGFSYIEVRPRPRSRRRVKKHSTIGMGLTTIIGFMSAAILMLAVA